QATMLAPTNSRTSLRALLLAAALALGLLACAQMAPAAAEAKVKFKIDGRGFGHGVGMSQWGAFGMAKNGKSHKRILSRYYRRTKLKSAKARNVGVLLSVRSGSASFRGARRACGRRVKTGKTYVAELSPSGKKVRLEKSSGRKLTSCGRKLSAVPKKKIEIFGDGLYRGKLVAKPDSGSLNVINRVGLEGYLKGVVPDEVPPSWPAKALRAQAVAARSYALATGVNGNGFTLYDDTRSQVYNGVRAEESSTNKAVRRTAGQVLKQGGDVITAFFFSSSGGRTENSEFGFSGGSPRPYLKSVKDPGDSASPYHRWRETYSRGKMQRLLGSRVKGRLKRIKVTRTGVSPRIVKAKVIGTAGKTTVTGDELRFALGLRSTWARFKRVKR
ncbi:MAG TPA: SpoIID/LytB domain-containing protein, partial [Solirubrobacterales bacterium]|nr:SpoIID/LytB domain-containing protein [Solirubrobacterales bacterium]